MCVRAGRPIWMPNLDASLCFAGTLLSRHGFHGFEHSVVRAVKVRNASCLGSQTPSKRKFKAGWLTPAPVVRSCLPCALSTRKHAASE
jgi:hypothetical protein